MYLNINIKESFRSLKSNESYKFDFKDPYILVVGKNGSGKSSLINIIRDFKCDNKADRESDEWSMKLGYSDISGFKNKATIDTDFTKFFFLSSEFDDPLALNNTASCDSFIKHGGYYLAHKSNGERNFQNLARWLNENKKDFDNKTLIIFDEADRGFELKYQAGFIKLMENLNKDYGCKCLSITHNAIPIILSKEVYCFDLRLTISSGTYLALETGYNFKVNKL